MLLNDSHFIVVLKTKQYIVENRLDELSSSSISIE